MNSKEFFKKYPPPQLSDRDDLAIQIGGMITKSRLAKSVSQKTLAKRMKLKQPSIARAETGSVIPSLVLLKKMARALGMKLVLPKFMDTNI